MAAKVIIFSSSELYILNREKDHVDEHVRRTLRTLPHPCLYLLHSHPCFLPPWSTVSFVLYLYFQCLCKYRHVWNFVKCICSVYRDDHVIFLLRSMLMNCLCILRISCTWSWLLFSLCAAAVWLLIFYLGFKDQYSRVRLTYHFFSGHSWLSMLSLLDTNNLSMFFVYVLEQFSVGVIHPLRIWLNLPGKILALVLLKNELLYNFI